MRSVYRPYGLRTTDDDDDGDDDDDESGTTTFEVNVFHC